jgi:CRISPR-associated endonuclease/helicase Cas3
VPYYAHSKPGRNKDSWQPLIEHLISTSQIAGELGVAAGVSDLVQIAAYLHDIGKYSDAFQKRLEGSLIRVDHSTAGAKVLVEELFPKGSKQHTVATMLAYCIAGHHTGLPDYGDATDVNNQGTLQSRLATPLEDFSAYKTELDLSQIKLPAYLRIRPWRQGGLFSYSFFTRMLYSALVDADFIETETYMNGGKKPRGGYASIEAITQLFNDQLTKFNNPTTDINRKRTETLRSCIIKSELDQGFFTLTVPTGGGKTLASMAFALNHAVKHRLRRIIYVIPYTSIIEQNAAVFKEYLGDENVLEHHSNFDWEQFKHTSQKQYGDDATRDAIQKLRLVAQNWDIPIVVTTNVQFFESLFANKSSRCRKLHNIAKSVVIFDEAQMIPVEFLKPCMAAIRELVWNYGVSSVFCTATQPSLECFFEDETFTELAPNPTDLYALYKRVDVTNEGTLDDATLIGRMTETEQALCIVNTRKHAKGLFSMLSKRVPEDDVFHLSTLMCPVHRKATIDTIRGRLREGKPCYVISTQIMEAGIDVDFPSGFRAMAGLDSIIQAAGRVNREAKRSGGSKLLVFEPDSIFVKRIPGYIRQGADIVRGIFRDYDDPVSLEAIQAYFDLLYTLQGEKALDAHRILQYFNKGTRALDFDFKTAAEKFKFIEDNTFPVLIPYDNEANRLVDLLKCVDNPVSLMKRLQRYTVNIYEREFHALEGMGLIDIYADTYAVLNAMAHYNPKTGIEIPESYGGYGIFP